MDARLLVRSKFMVSHEFGSGDIPKEPLVTIADVIKPSEQDETTKDWWLITFREPWAKPLKVNRTHQQALILMFGGTTEGWRDKRIGLYPLAGTFFGRRQTAVRIKGSPDIKAPASFQVRKFGGGKDTYNLEVMPSPGATAPRPTPNGKTKKPTPYVSGVVWWGPVMGMQIAVLAHAELNTAIAHYERWLSDAPPSATGRAHTQTNLDELRAELVRRNDIEKLLDANAPPDAEQPTNTPPF